MIERTKIEGLIRELTEKNEIFIVSLVISPSNKITLLVDSMKGLQIRECVQLSRAIESGLDREEVDFELEVSSPGLGEPLKVVAQYVKNIGREVEVLLSNGSKVVGKLIEANADGFKIEEKKSIKGKKQMIFENRAFMYPEVNKVKIVVKI
jgi:ribosome maturation factor RimP